MEQLKTLIEGSNGLSSLDSLLKVIADALNVSVSHLQSNLGDYLSMIGRYGLIDNIFGYGMGILFGATAIFIVIATLSCLDAYGNNFSSDKFKIRLRYSWIIFVPSVMYAIQQIAIYWASPEIYSIVYLKGILGM